MRLQYGCLALVLVIASVVAGAPAALAQPSPPTLPNSPTSIPQSQSTDPATQVQVYLESQGYSVRKVQVQGTTAIVLMDMVSGVFDEDGKAQVVHGWYALAQAYPQARELWTGLLYQQRYLIVFQVLAQDFRDWVDGKIRPQDLHYTVEVYDLQTGDVVRDKDFIRKNFVGTQPGRGQSLGTLPTLKFVNPWLLYRDDFSDELSGWEISDTEAGSAGYVNGEYRITVKIPDTAYWAGTPGNIRDFAVAVKARQASGDARNPYGIIFCYQDDDNLCAFFVTAEGRYTVIRRAAGNWQTIHPWTASDALKQGQLTNLLRVEVQGDEVRVYANGRTLTAATVTGLTKGKVGLAAGVFDRAPTEVYFDDVALFGANADWRGDPGTGGEPAHKLQPVRREAVPAAARESLTTLLRQADAAPPYDNHDFAVRLEGLPANLSRTLDQPPQYRIGDTETFYVAKGSKAVQVQATLVYETAHARAWIEKGADVDLNAVKSATDKFEAIYEKDRAFFGSEWTPGVDGDVRVHIFNGDIPNLAGYFSPLNEYRQEVSQYSNQKEMFFMNAVGTPPGTNEYLGTLAHEFQHMIHWTNKSGNDLWMNEGCSQLAEYLIGLDLPGVVIAHSRYPDRQLNAFDQGLDARAPYYGQSYLFLVYFMSRFGRERTQQLLSLEGRGTRAFDQVLAAQGLTFDEVFADWLVANLINDPGLDARYGYPSDVDVVRPRFAQAHRAYPAQAHADVHQYAADYIRLELPPPTEGRAGDGGSLRIDFTGSTVVPIGPGQAHSGSKVWWFGWGDTLNPRLTRQFDLTNARRPQLEAWMWYDTVNGTGTKMYGFWSVSTDGGATWETSEDQVLYRRSGGGDTAQWIKHTVDLTRYAGRRVQVRFEAITLNGEPVPGYAIDDITIADIGYRHDAESSDDGWVGEGFVRIMPLLPQAWTVQVIEMDGDKATAVHRMQLNSSNQGSLTVSGLGGSKTAVLVIAAQTPYAIEWAPYEYKVSQ